MANGPATTQSFGAVEDERLWRTGTTDQQLCNSIKAMEKPSQSHVVSTEFNDLAASARCAIEYHHIVRGQDEVLRRRRAHVP